MYRPQPLSRATSSSSISSDDAQPRRTRKRFNSAQLILLEETYRKTTHPTRQVKEELARQIETDLRAVTVWFQNRRQSFRKSIGYNSTISIGTSPEQFASEATILRRISSSSSTAIFSYHHEARSNLRPTLDKVASLSELPIGVPRTPIKSSNDGSKLWESMLSSPPQPHSPQMIPEIEFRYYKANNAPPKRSLEWACASIRPLESDLNRTSGVLRDIVNRQTSIAEVSPLKPSATTTNVTLVAVNKKREDDDVLTAAWALCGLGRQ